jgi:drug/metabolite transporter (DMT)-like permease
MITYSGAHENDSTSDDSDKPAKSGPKEPPHRMLGDLIMLIGAICLGFYEVIYKMSLPEGHDTTEYPSRPALPLEGTRRSSSLLLVRQEINHPRSSSLPLALHANFLTSLIGAATLLLFWIPIPLLHWTGLEEFELPYGHFGLLAVICMMGATYVSIRME